MGVPRAPAAALDEGEARQASTCAALDASTAHHYPRYMYHLHN